MTEISILNSRPGARKAAERRRSDAHAPSWTRSRVVAAVLDFAFWTGPTNLELIDVSRRIRVPVAVLYSLFGSRDGLLEAVAQQAETELYVHDHSAGQSWEHELRSHYHEVRASLHRRPFLADFVFYRGQTSASCDLSDVEANAHLLGHVDAMTRAGIDGDLAARSLRAMTGFTVAFVMQTERVDAGLGCLRRREAQGEGRWQPYVVDEADHLAFDEQFEISLELMLRGLRAVTREASRQSDCPPSPALAPRPILTAAPGTCGGQSPKVV